MTSIVVSDETTSPFISLTQVQDAYNDLDANIDVEVITKHDFF